MGPLFYMFFYKSGLYDIFSLNKFFKKKGGKGMAINYEQFNEMRDSLTASDFRSVLSYYGLTIERNGFLCPFHQSEHHQTAGYKVVESRLIATCVSARSTLWTLHSILKAAHHWKPWSSCGDRYLDSSSGKGRAETAHPELQIPSYDRPLPSHRHQYGDSE